MTATTFKDLGLVEDLCDACDRLQWTAPTPIQKEAIPVALNGSDVVGLAETGSGKTGAFGLPILQALLLKPQKMFALILTPTRELAIQIKEQLDDLGKDIGLTSVAIVGGINMKRQGASLLKKPHIIVATLGRLVDHVKHLKGFASSLKNIKYLVMDEADRILTQDFEKELDTVMQALPTDRTTMMFSATITNKVQELQRAHLRNPVKVQINSSFKLVDTLQQYMISMPIDDRHVYLVHLLRSFNQKSVLVFCDTRRSVLKTVLILKQFNITAIPLFGDMRQTKRLQALADFTSKEKSVMVSTNVASRGLDIPCVDYVINLEVPSKSEDYIHRVGRTARAGRTGTAITFVSQYEIEFFLRIEECLMPGTETQWMPPYDVDRQEAKKLIDQVTAADRNAKKEMKVLDEIRASKRKDEDEEDDRQMGPGGGSKRNHGNFDNRQHKKKKFRR